MAWNANPASSSKAVDCVARVWTQYRGGFCLFRCAWNVWIASKAYQTSTISIEAVLEWKSWDHDQELVLNKSVCIVCVCVCMCVCVCVCVCQGGLTEYSGHAALPLYRSRSADFPVHQSTVVPPEHRSVCVCVCVCLPNCEWVL